MLWLIAMLQTRISAVVKEAREELAAQEILTAALQHDREFARETGGGDGGLISSGRIVATEFVFWTTGLNVDVEEEVDEPPAHRYMGDDEDGYSMHNSDYDGYSDYDGRSDYDGHSDYDYWDSFDRFAGSKTHSTVFAGFASRRPDMSNFEYAGKCPIPECGEHVYTLEDDEIDDPTGIRDALRRRRDALDIEHVYSNGDYGGASPDEFQAKVCSKGCMYGHASIHLSMAGKLGWAAGY